MLYSGHMSENTTTNDTPLTVTLDLFGETRTVALSLYRPDSPTATVFGQLVAQQNGYAAKARYVETLMLWRVTDKPAHRGNTVVTASDGSVWEFHLSTVVRNRQGRFVGWKDVVGATNFENNQRTAK
jgi:hypothetical protein